jgi:hypothetical protein
LTPKTSKYFVNNDTVIIILMLLVLVILMLVDHRILHTLISTALMMIAEVPADFRKVMTYNNRLEANTILMLMILMLVTPMLVAH